MGQRASNTVELTFENVRVPQANLLGKPGRGFSIALQTLDFGRSGVAALSVGVARAALEYATALCQRTPAVRRAHHHQPGHFLHAGRHGHEGRSSAAAHLAGRLDGRPRA